LWFIFVVREVENLLLQHLGILLSSDFLTANQISSSQNKNTLLEYSTQIKIVEEKLETKSCTHKHQYFWVDTPGKTPEGKPVLENDFIMLKLGLP
jgi:hypothetical protein